MAPPIDAPPRSRATPAIAGDRSFGDLATARALTLVSLIRQTDQLRKAATRSVLTAHDLNETQWLTLSLVKDNIVGTAADVARVLDYDPGALTRLLDALYERDLLTKSPRCTDRRAVVLGVTPTGRRVAEQSGADVKALWTALFDDWTVDEVDRLRALLVRLANSMNSETTRRPSSSRAVNPAETIGN